MSRISVAKGLTVPQPGQGGRPYTERKIYLAKIVNGLPVSVNVLFTLINPSTRFGVGLWVYWEPVTLPVVLPTAPTITIEHAVLPPNSSASEQTAGTFLAATTIPTFVEIPATMSSRYRGTVAVGTLAAGNTGAWVLLARWEPSTDIPPFELERLFCDCDVTLQGPIQTL